MNGKLSRSYGTQAQRDVRRRLLIELRQLGKSWGEIGRIVGMDRANAHKMVHGHRKRKPK